MLDVYIVNNAEIRTHPRTTQSFLSASYQKYDFAVELPSSKYRLIPWALCA